MLLGLPTSIAVATVLTVGCGAHSAPPAKAVMAGFALVARTISRIGTPIRRAHMAAAAFPRLPLGTMKPGSAPWRRIHSVAAQV
jgi:hypothetical protein